MAMTAPQFVIYCPPYTEKSSGVRALHRLCHLLNTAGYRAVVHTRTLGPHSVNKKWQTPLWSEGSTAESTVVIYPEIIVGNPLQAKRIVRWTLNYPGVFAGDH